MENRLESMTMVDSFWLNMDDPTNLMVITSVIELDELLDFNKFIQLLEKRLLCFNRFRQKAIFPMTKFGPPFWEIDSNFDIRNHVTRVALPGSGDKATLQRMISDLTVVPLDPKKPLWHIHLIENYGDDNKGCAFFIRIHHAIADGIALIRLLLSLMDLEPNPLFAKEDEVYDYKKTSGHKKNTNVVDKVAVPIGRAMKATVNASSKVLGTLYQESLRTIAHPTHFSNMSKLLSNIALESATIIARLLLLPSDSQTALKSDKIGIRKSVCWSDPVDLEDIKKIGKEYGATINDILMSAVAGSIRNYLIGRGEDMEDKEFRVMIPINVRQLIPKIELGNEFSLVMLNLPIFIEDPIERLREISKRMNELKGSSEAFVGFQALKLMGIPPKSISKKASNIFSSKVSAVLSNVPGPRQPLYMVDKKIKNMVFWVPRTGTTALGISIISYAGNVTLGIATDTSLAPDPELISDDFTNEFKRMLKLIKKTKKS